MTEICYLFFRDDGVVFGTSEIPTPEDLDHAKVGIVTIIRTADYYHFGRDGCWRPTQCGKLVVAEMEDGPSEPFHVPANF